MSHKVLTVEEKLRAFAEEAAAMSNKSFEHLREAIKCMNRSEALWIEELQFLSSVKGKNQWRCPESRLFSRHGRLLPVCVEMRDETTGELYRSSLLPELNDLPLDEMEADAKAAREEMLSMRTHEDWNQ